MKRALPIAIAVVGFGALIVLAVYLETMFWQECRASNSFWYCFRLMGR